MTNMEEGSKGAISVFVCGRGGLSQVLDSTAGTKTGSGDPAVPKTISRQFVNNPTLQHLYDEISSRLGDKSDLLVCIYGTKHMPVEGLIVSAEQQNIHDPYFCVAVDSWNTRGELLIWSSCLFGNLWIIAYLADLTSQKDTLESTHLYAIFLMWVEECAFLMPS